MPDQNAYTQIGMRGFTLPAPDLILMNLFHPGYGIYSWDYFYTLGTNQDEMWRRYLQRLDEAGASRERQEPQPGTTSPRPKCK